MTAGAIAANFETARPTVSKHLQILTECELLAQEQNGREIYYHLNPEKMDDIDKWLSEFKKAWETRFSQLDDLLAKIK